MAFHGRSIKTNCLWNPGSSEAEDAWLTNFSDNPIEWFTQFHVRFAASHLAYRDKRIGEIPGEIAALKKQTWVEGRFGREDCERGKTDRQSHGHLEAVRGGTQRMDAGEIRQTLPSCQKPVMPGRFPRTLDDPAYRQLAEISYRDGRVQRRVKVPKGDVLHQFREDVKSGTLPTVSWIVSPQDFPIIRRPRGTAPGTFRKFWTSSLTIQRFGRKPSSS